MSNDFPSRKKLRLAGHSYTEGTYFITISHGNHGKVFGFIKTTVMTLNDYGRIASEHWRSLPLFFPNLLNDDFVFMPDHMHGIISLRAGEAVRPVSLPEVIQRYKRIVTIRMKHQGLTVPSNFWQKSFYDRIIHSEAELSAIRNYIQQNPAMWRANNHSATY